MANYEYYRELYTRRRDAQMERVLTTAYNELMANYKEDVRVQEMLYESLREYRKLNQKAIQDYNKIITTAAGKGSGGAGRSGDFTLKDFYQVYNQAMGTISDVQKQETDVNTQAWSIADGKFKIPQSTMSAYSRLIRDNQATQSETGWNWFKSKIPEITINTTQEQMMQFFVDYGPIIADATGEEWDPAFKVDLAKSLGLPARKGKVLIPSQDSIEAAKLKLVDQHKVRNPVDKRFAGEHYNLTKGLMTQGINVTPLQSKQSVKGQLQPELIDLPPELKGLMMQGINVTPSQSKQSVKSKSVAQNIAELKGQLQPELIDLPPELKNLKLQRIAPPTRQDVLKRAAEIYEPQAPRSFRKAKAKAQMPTKESMRGAFMGMVEKDAEEAIKASIPDHLKPLVRLEDKVASISDKSMDDIKQMSGVGYQYGVQLVQGKNKGTEEVMATIQNNPDLTPEQKEQAYTVVASQLYRSYMDRKQPEIK